MRGQGDVVGVGNFLRARDLEGPLKSYAGGTETPAWGCPKHCGTASPTHFQNVAEVESLKAAGPGLWGQAHHQPGAPEGRAGIQGLPLRRYLPLLAE